ncbi:HAD family hydrolase [Streptomyces drozdowiczii]|uniref:HAD family hydrolase n=1 Tax=Streptomyces drozdowiczii TaxID=202862 RepID=A0ABY6PQ60_9ACTN|nr:HAD family hydrolase [Streptomyces drozdowiczii]MCX0246593.1 HAD family hydrolase [Streptomyces drozdowiczii]UZK53929.1 HAD family hydrolase [Streptomyces drozdowiczii]
MTAPSSMAVLFDLDDTLINYSSAAAKERESVHRLVRPHLPADAMDGFWERYEGHLARHHVEVDTGRATVADYRESRLRHALEPWGKPSPALAAAVALCADMTAARVELHAGVNEVLGSLREAGVRLGIITNGPGSIQNAKCARLGLAAAVDTVVTSQDAGRTKPDAAVFHMALDRLATSPDRCVVVGDSWENDVLGAIRAGVGAAVHIRRPGTPARTADGVLGQLPRVDRELLELLEVRRGGN